MGLCLSDCRLSSNRTEKIKTKQFNFSPILSKYIVEFFVIFNCSIKKKIMKQFSVNLAKSARFQF